MRTTFDLNNPTDQRAVGERLRGIVEGFSNGEPVGRGLEALDAVLLHLQQEADRAVRERARGSFWQRLFSTTTGALAEPSPLDLARLEGYLAALADVRQAIVANALRAIHPPAEEQAQEPLRGHRHVGLGRSGVRP